MDNVLPLSSAPLTSCSNRVMKPSPMKYVQALTLTHFSPSLTYYTTHPPFSVDSLLSSPSLPPPICFYYFLSPPLVALLLIRLLPSHVFFPSLCPGGIQLSALTDAESVQTHAKAKRATINTAGHRKQAAWKEEEGAEEGDIKNSSSVL